MNLRRSLAIVAIGTGLIAAPASAQDMRAASEKVVACQSVEDSAAKLACFETAAAELSTILAAPAPIAEARVEVPPAPTQPIKMAATETAPATSVTAESETDAPLAGPPKRRLLPSWVPTVSLSIGSGDSVKEPDFFETEITRIQRNNIGRHFFTTSDGQVWSQIQVGKIRAPSSLPAKAIIRQSFTGSIRLEIESNGRVYPVKRVE